MRDANRKAMWAKRGKEIGVVGDWNIVDRVKDKNEDWTRIKNSNEDTIDIWKSQNKRNKGWNVTMNGSFITQGRSKKESERSANWYMNKYYL